MAGTAVVGLAILAGACGAGGGPTRSELEAGHDLVDVPGIGLVPANEASTYLEWAEQGGHDLVDVPGIGLVPANEASTYLVEPGRDD